MLSQFLYLGLADLLVTRSLTFGAFMFTECYRDIKIQKCGSIDIRAHDKFPTGTKMILPQGTQRRRQERKAKGSRDRILATLAYDLANFAVNSRPLKSMTDGSPSKRDISKESHR